MRREQSGSDREVDGSASTHGGSDRTAASKSDSRTGAVAALQRAVGNRVLQDLCENGDREPTLSVSQPDDRAERDAERTADRLLRMPVSGSDADRSARSGNETTANSSTADDAGGSHSPDATGIGGVPLPATTRKSFETRFGARFHNVRIHTGAEADRAARSLDARAVTVGTDIVFRRGEYDPETSAGRRLLAHELAHVRQDSKEIQRQPSGMQSATNTVEQSRATAEQEAHEEAASQSGQSTASQRSTVAKQAAEAQFDTGSAVTGANETFYRINAPYEAVPDNWAHTIDGKTVASITEFEVYSRISQFDFQNPMTVNWSFSSLEVSLPRWTRFENESASLPERLEWARFMRNLREHEQGHVDICHEYMNNIPSQLQTLQAQSQQAAGQQLRSYHDRAVQEIETRFDDYDSRTNHGETQGATLRPPSELDRREEEQEE